MLDHKSYRHCCEWSTFFVADKMPPGAINFVIWSISCPASALLCIQRMAPTIKLSLVLLASQCYSWSRQSSDLRPLLPCRYHIMCQSSIRSHFLPVPTLVMTSLSITKSSMLQPQYLWHATSMYVRVAVQVVAHCCTIFPCLSTKSDNQWQRLSSKAISYPGGCCLPTFRPGQSWSALIMKNNLLAL